MNDSQEKKKNCENYNDVQFFYSIKEHFCSEYIRKNRKIIEGAIERRKEQCENNNNILKIFISIVACSVCNIKLK